MHPVLAYMLAMALRGRAASWHGRHAEAPPAVLDGGLEAPALCEMEAGGCPQGQFSLGAAPLHLAKRKAMSVLRSNRPPFWAQPASPISTPRCL